MKEKHKRCPITNNLREKIKAYCEKYSETKLAGLLGVTPQCVSNWCRKEAISMDKNNHVSLRKILELEPVIPIPQFSQSNSNFFNGNNHGRGTQNVTSSSDQVEIFKANLLVSIYSSKELEEDAKSKVMQIFANLEKGRMND